VPPVLILALGSFAMGTDSFVLAGILPQLASGLVASQSAAGQVVTTFALTYALAAPVLAALTSRLPRKPLMAVALVLFVAANLASAAAPALTVLLLARVAAGLGAALYTPNASAAAVALAGPARRGQALSIILGGLTVGTVLGVPAGTAIGQHITWRASLIFVAAVGTVALLGVLVTLPALPALPPVPMAQRFGLLVNRRVLAIVAVMTLASAASIIVYTYIAQILRATAHITGTSLAIALLAWGLGGTIGAFGSGWLTDRYGAYRTLLLALTVLTATLAGLGYVASTALVLALMVLNGAAAWAVATPNNHRLTALVPRLPSVVISYNSSGIYLGQALGAALGGLLLMHAASATTVCLAGTVLGLGALGGHLLLRRTPLASAPVESPA
jgi:predicted MFS family arabinose efflux permease